MSSLSQSRFVLFPLGTKRFALQAEVVSELARPDKEQTFPHTTPIMRGVLVRRGTIIPVCDVAQVLAVGAPARKFYLIATRKFGNSAELTALPVTGECELTSSDVLQPTAGLPGYVVGLLSLPNEIVELIDLDKLVSAEASA